MATLSSSFSSLSLHTTPHRLSKTFTKQPFSFPLPTKSSPSFPSITLRAQSSTDDIASFFDNLPPEEDSVFDPPTPPDDFIPTPYFDESPIEADEDITAAYEELYGPAYSGVSVLGNDVHMMDAKKKKLTGWGKPKKEKLRDGFDERVVQVRRVTKVVKGGKQLHFRAVVVVGDKQGNVGVGVGKAKEVIAAVQKSAVDARRNIVAVPLTKYSTFPHSRRESEHELHPSEGLPASVAGGIVALGKFDALHIGHRELAIQASKLGAPYLLSFVGMAEVFGWEPRAPIVAKCDRSRVLSSWSPYCGNLAPTEVRIEFSSVRHLTPKQFVEKLSKELGVGGVVAGENYRFGYKAAGDALDLVRLCEEYGIGAYIINSVMDKNQDHRSLDSSDKKDKGQVSSTRVRHALDVGDMRYVSELLGRQHRLILIVKDMKELPNTSGRCRISAPKSCLLNQPPKDGLYGNCFLLFGSENQVPCRVFIDTSQIHLEVDGLELSNYNDSHEARLLGIEFGECGSDSA